MTEDKHSLVHECTAELVGTFILAFFGTGVVHVAVLTGALSGLWQVAVVWALAVTLAIYATAAVSGAHINPAMTIAFAAHRQFPWSKSGPYIASQVLGAFAAAGVLYLLFNNYIADFEQAHNIVRGSAGSELSAKVFGEYFPNPSDACPLETQYAKVSLIQAMLAEGIGTAFLAFFVFALTDSRNRERPGMNLAPLFIGLTVAMVIMIVAPLTQAGLNPARDFGPRLFSYFAGWGRIAIPGPRGGFFTVYILSPIIGAVIGGGVYQRVIRTCKALVSARSGEREQSVIRQDHVTVK
ncbi:MAG: MIP/aquaporin family protein [Planctomycetota bacterium]